MSENHSYKLPPFPFLDGRIPHTSQCVPLDGKIYVVGGEFYAAGPGIMRGSNGVYVLDLGLSGGWQWKQCARMTEPRVQFGCTVLDGKIYVFGGLGNRRPLCGSEVYDPEEDTWSPIKDMPCLRYDHQVGTVGAELLVHGGKVVEERPSVEIWNVLLPDDIRKEELLDVYEQAKTANSLEVYNAVKDEWSVVEGVQRQETDLSFMAKGKLHLMNSYEIHVRDTETNSWTYLHSHSLSSRGLVDSQVILLRSAVAVKDRVLTIVEGLDNYGEINLCKACLLYSSSGLGSANEEIKWGRAAFTVYFEDEDVKFTNYDMHPIEL